MHKIKTAEKILIVKPSSLGDVVHSLPFLNAVKERFPKAEIHWVIAKGLEGLLTGHPMIHKVWLINKDMWKKTTHIPHSFKEIHTLFRKLRKEHFDIVVDLQGLLRSGIITMMTGAPLRVGFKEAREGSRFFYTHKIEGGKDIHAVDRYLKIAGFLGCTTTDIYFPFPLSFNSSPITHHSSLSGDYAVIVPGARKPANRWPARKFGELASMLPLRTLVIGSSSDTMLADEVVKTSKGNATSIAGKTNIKGLIEVIRGAKFVVSNDTGPMHIAAALGVPVFAIFGPADPKRTGPYGKGHTVIKEDISCAPCFKKKCKDIKCMYTLSVEKVYGVIAKKLVT